MVTSVTANWKQLGKYGLEGPITFGFFRLQICSLHDAEDQLGFSLIHTESGVSVYKSV